MNDFLQRLNVGRRLGMAFGILVLLSGLLVATGLITMSNARYELDTIVNNNMERIRLSSEMLDANTNVAIGLRDVVMVSGDTANRRALHIIEKSRARYKQAHDALAAMPSSELEKNALALVQEKRDVSVKFNNQILDYGMRDQNQQAQALLQGAAAAAMDEQQAAIAANAALERRLSKDAYAAAVASMHNGQDHPGQRRHRCTGDQCAARMVDHAQPHHAVEPGHAHCRSHRRRQSAQRCAHHRNG